LARSEWVGIPNEQPGNYTLKERTAKARIAKERIAQPKPLLYFSGEFIYKL
jgi:hypothetical protein